MLGKIISILLISSVKFIFAFPLAYKYHFPFYTTFILTSIGGIGGVLFFSFFWEHVIKLYLWFIHSYLYKFPQIRSKLKKLKEVIFSPKKIQKENNFRRKRRYVWIKKNGGLLGIAVLTPIILSIPIGTFLAVRFFERTFQSMLFLCLAVFAWSSLLSCLIHIVGFRF